jgi:NAD(P)H dehydrogenase (quinone)
MGLMATTPTRGVLEAAFSGVEKLLFISTSALGQERMLHHRNRVNAAKGARVKHIIYTSVIKPAIAKPLD